MSYPKPKISFLFLLLLLTWTTMSAVAVLSPPQAEAQTEIACGDEEEPEPEVDEDGILVDPDDSTPEEQAADYDDSAEDEEIPEEEGYEMTEEEAAAFDECLADAVEDTWKNAVDAFDTAWNGRKTLLLGTVGPEELPYGGTAEFRLEAGTAARTARAAKANRTVLGKSTLKLHSGDSKKLNFRLNQKGRKALRNKGRIVATGTLKLTDKLTGISRSKKSRVVLKHKR